MSFSSSGSPHFSYRWDRGAISGSRTCRTTPREGGGWFDVSWDYHAQYDMIVTGRPVGESEISDDGMLFTRTFEKTGRFG